MSTTLRNSIAFLHMGSKRGLLAILCLFQSLYGAWDPACLGLAQEELKILPKIERQALLTSFQNALGSTDNLYCTAEKINLILDLILLTRPEVCVEVGVYTGASFLVILNALQFLDHGMAYGVDAWSNEKATKWIPPNDPNYSWWNAQNLDDVYQHFLRRIAKRSLFLYSHILRCSSDIGASQIGSIDFLHLDGDFSERGALLDVGCYLPKVKSGGYVLLSNVFYVIDQKPSKMKALWAILDECELVAEIENSNTILFRKN